MENSNKLDSRKDNSQFVILEKINSALGALGIEDQYIKAPDFLPEYEVLKGKKILIVDDIKGVIANNLPEFIVATDGNAGAVCHTEQSFDELVSEILASKPDIILMDYSLANRITGIDVINELKANGYTGKTVGYSSEKSRDAEFKRAGAIGSINKTGYEVSDSVKALISLL